MSLQLQPVHIDSLSIEMLSQIFSHLSVQELVASINVCRTWRQTIGNDVRFESTEGRLIDIRRVWEKKSEGLNKEIRSLTEVMAQVQIGHVVQIERSDLYRDLHLARLRYNQPPLSYDYGRPETGVCVVRKF